MWLCLNKLVNILRIIPQSYRLAIGEYIQSWRSYPKSLTNLFTAVPDDPILVTGPYRSGTSWVGDALALQGVWYLHEPFNPNKGFWNKNFTYRRAHEVDQKLNAFVDRLLAGKILFGPGGGILKGVPSNRRFMPARIGLFPKPNRVLIKDPIACLLTEYLVHNFNMRAVVVIRHPAGFVSSLKKLNWDVRGEIRQLLETEKLVTDWLTPFVDILEESISSSRIVARTAFYAALVVILRGFSLRTPNVKLYQFEHLCDVPEKAFEEICVDLNLSCNNQILEYFSGLSDVRLKDQDNYQPFDTRRHSQTMRDIWKLRLDANESRLVRDTWMKFELPFYTGDEHWVINN